MTAEGTKICARSLVLVADDDPTTRLIMREVLEQGGMDVVEACDGREALYIYEKTSPDVMLLDVGMPHLDGFEVCQQIRAKETNRTMPICMVTGLNDIDSADRAYHVGATDFVSKPICWPLLIYRVRYLLRASNALNEIQGLVSALPDAIFVVDENGSEIESTSVTENGNRHGNPTIKESAFSDLFNQEAQSSMQANVELALSSREPQVFEHYFSQGEVHLETRFVARDRNSVLAIVRDVTKRKESDEQIFKLAYYDRLTGLPNRRLFSQELERILRDDHQKKSRFAMLFFDLDHFKRINDTLGHSMGDELLKAVSRRLQSCTRANDCLTHLDAQSSGELKLARLGGDEFVIILHNVDTQKTASRIAQRIVEAMAKPFNCLHHQLVVTPSIGIALYPEDGQSKEELLMNADSAMYRAKQAGRNNFQFYSGTMKVRSLHRLGLEGDLRTAIERKEFELYYQPKVDLASWSIIGAEALLRWNHAERGFISPVDFIPIAEETGLILPLGEWVMDAACQQIKKWQHSRLCNLSVSVNVSTIQVGSDALVRTVEKILSSTAIDATKLELEITESVLMQDVEATILTLKALKGLGVGLSIDDFGTGYSSLSYLKRFPIDALKIDRSFVSDLQCDNDDAAICSAILAMAHSLELKVVAEGVELDDQVKFLLEHDCDQIQGYLFSKPVPVKAFEQLYLDHHQTKKTEAV